MKKVNLFLVKAFALVLFMGLNASTFAQNSIQSVIKEINAAVGVPYTQKIVAENQTTTISFSQVGYSNLHYEFYRTSTASGILNSQSAWLSNSGFIIKDMQVFNSRIYFCGEYQSQGFIAWANIAVLFTSPIGTFQYDIIKTSQSIDKIEVYNNNSGMQIACIGVDVNNQSFFLHLDYGTLNYEMFYSNYPKEIIDDLEINSQYVVTVGHANSLSAGGSDIIITRYDINNVNINNQFALNFAQASVLKKLHAKTIHNDFLAVVGATDYNGAATLAFIFDVINPLSIPQSEYFIGYKNQNIDVRDLTYYNVDKKMVILGYTTSQPSATPMDAAIIWDVSLTPSGAVNIYYGQNANAVNLLLNGIVEYDAYNFAAIGIDTTNNAINVWYGDRSLTGNFQCNQGVKDPLQTIPYQFIQPYNVTLTLNNKINWIQETTYVSSPLVIPNCQ